MTSVVVTNRLGTRTLLALSVGILTLMAQPVVAQQPAVAAIVEQFYPSTLTAFPDEIGGRQQCFAVYDADASGAPHTIVAAYTNDSEAAVRILRAGTGGFYVAAEPPAALDLTGVQCNVVLEDIDADGRRDIRIDFSVNRATVSWLFRWDGQQLVDLTPTAPVIGGQSSLFVNGALVDTDNDGIKEIYVQPEYPRFPDEPVLPGLLYRLSGDRYIETATRLIGIWLVEREAGAPETTIVQVTRPEGAGPPYTLRVVNGLPDGSARATSARLWLNAREILAPTDFGTSAGVIERQVVLTSDTELSVRFAGQPSSRMLISIESGR